MSTDPLDTEASTEAAAAPGAGAAPEAEAPPETESDTAPDTATATGTEAGTDAEAGAAAGEAGEAAEGAGAAGAPALSEAEAELAAQRELRARIEQRKAEKDGPIQAGTKLSGRAADLLAAVRAVEGGEKPSAHFPPPAPEPRRPAPAPQAEPRPVVRPAAAPAGAAPESVSSVRAVLAAGGAPESLAVRTAETLGEQAADSLRDDPWQLLSVPGVRPEQADGFARALLGAECGPADERRAAALVSWLLERAALQGHTALESDTVRAALAERSVPDPDGALQSAVADGAVLVFQDALDTPPGGPAAQEAPQDDDGSGSEDGAAPGPVRVLLGLDRYALAEESLADGLARLVNAGSIPPGGGQADWEQAAADAPSPSAAELIRTVARNGLVAHTGGEAARDEPAAVVTAARALGLRAYAAAHTPDGKRRLAAALDDPAAAVTVSGLLTGSEGPGRDGEGALALDLLAVVDAPQLDVESAAMLVESLADGVRLVLSGDPGVLGSAGAGQVFTDVLAARACPQLASRTPDPGPIGELVSGIGIGELNQVAAPGKEVVIVPVRDPGEAVHRTVQLVADSVPRAIGVPVSDTQVITPGHGGPAGTRALNAALKERLNPGPGRFGGFDPGDRAAYIPAPGRTLPGTVVSADGDGLRLDCAGTPVTVPKDRVEASVRHGWALTAHQAAGLRWPAVVVVLPGDAAGGLSRPWVYTAFGRGERHLSVVHGVDQALPHAVAEVPAQPRTTRLRTLLRPAAD
ncbi:MULTISPECIES: ATP-dependent RecD-like DNA helicase [unclassified Streptomyces]|uniref:ATP-dependent RecD-like DNA helicase n=1 Tax=unclassified Streptomyces TaxID=2593676 RepID=UPI002E13BA05|nr:ATP-dependent RecD-like DNA helicase [Streptomyces sp. NBC_01197]WSS48202.1 ATP-dependent RecD-like DNA helicase [Streptomyces sp. NBC_01180]